MSNRNLLKSRVGKIHVKRIRVNQGVGVYIFSTHKRPFLSFEGFFFENSVLMYGKCLKAYDSLPQDLFSMTLCLSIGILSLWVCRIHLPPKIN